MVRRRCVGMVQNRLTLTELTEPVTAPDVNGALVGHDHAMILSGSTTYSEFFLAATVTMRCIAATGAVAIFR